MLKHSFYVTLRDDYFLIFSKKFHIPSVLTIEILWCLICSINSLNFDQTGCKPKGLCVMFNLVCLLP